MFHSLIELLVTSEARIVETTETTLTIETSNRWIDHYGAGILSSGGIIHPRQIKSAEIEYSKVELFVTLVMLWIGFNRSDLIDHPALNDFLAYYESAEEELLQKEGAFRIEWETGMGSVTLSK